MSYSLDYLLMAMTQFSQYNMLPTIAMLVGSVLFTAKTLYAYQHQSIFPSKFSFQDGNIHKCTPTAPAGGYSADGGVLYDGNGDPITTEAGLAQLQSVYSEQALSNGVTLGLVYVRYCREPSQKRLRELHAKYHIVGQRINAFQGWSVVFIANADIHQTVSLAEALSLESDIYETQLRSPRLIQGL